MADTPTGGRRARENWGTKLGVILAVSGSAVGLGNFLRFPGKAAANGGGAFLIPYFISLLILGIPICWAEWTLGRQGGRQGFNSAPGVVFSLTRNPVLRLFGALAILIPVVIYMYYVYIEAWCLGYAWDYAVGNLKSLGVQVDAYRQYFHQFVGADQNGFMRTVTEGSETKVVLSRVVYFLIIVFLINFVLIYRGVTRGIETFCKYAMPLLVVAALVVLGRVLTLPPQPVPEPWQFAMAEAVPEQNWTAFVDGLRRTDDQLRAIEDTADADAVARGRAAAAESFTGEFRNTLNDYYKGIIARRDGYRADVPVAGPYGYLASVDGVRYALRQLEDPQDAAAHREWVRQTRHTLTREQVWDLLHYEAIEAKLLHTLADRKATEAQKGVAEAELREKRAERIALMEEIGLSSWLERQRHTSDRHLRGAAAEVAELDRTVTNGLGYMWNPFTAEGGRSIWAALSRPQVWLEASCQIFFSLSVGFGIIITYATYLRRNDDVVLNGLTAASTNEFCEVCLGGMITIPAAFIFLGLGSLQGAGTFDLGFLTTPAVFAQMPAGRFFGFVWFFMLFLAAVTSSLSMLQPAIAFLEEGFNRSRRGSGALLGLLTANGILVVLYFSEGLKGLDTMDFWAGNLCIFVMAGTLVILFSWVIGAERCIKLAGQGAELPLPRLFLPVIKYIAPTYLLVIFVFWLRENARDYVESVLTDSTATFVVAFVVLLLIFFAVLVRLANQKWTQEGREVQEIDP